MRAGHQIPAIENLGAAADHESIDFTDNHISMLGNFPRAPRLQTLLCARNRINRIQLNLAGSLPVLTTLVLTDNHLADLPDLDPLAHFPKLEHVVLVDNPVTKKEVCCLCSASYHISRAYARCTRSIGPRQTSGHLLSRSSIPVASSYLTDHPTPPTPSPDGRGPPSSQTMTAPSLPPLTAVSHRLSPPITLVATNTSRQHYRAYLLWLAPQIRFLDFQKVKDAERALARDLFGPTPDAPTDLARSIRASAHRPSASAPKPAAMLPNGGGAKRGAKLRLSDAEKARFEARLKKAATLAEVQQLEKMLSEGRLPPGVADGEEGDDVVGAT